MNRRHFVISAGAAGAALGLGISHIPRAFAQTPIYDFSKLVWKQAIAAMATIHMKGVNATADDWGLVAATIDSCYWDWVNADYWVPIGQVSNGVGSFFLNGQISRAVQNFPLGVLRSTNADLSKAVAAIQAVYPSYNASQLSATLAQLDAYSDSVKQLGIGYIQFLMSNVLANIAIEAYRWQEYLQGYRNPSIAQPAYDPFFRCVCPPTPPQLPIGVPPIGGSRFPRDPGNGGGGSTNKNTPPKYYSCAYDSLFVAAVGVATLVLAIMTAPVSAAVITIFTTEETIVATAPMLLGASGASLSAFSGIAAGIWGAGHLTICGL